MKRGDLNADFICSLAARLHTRLYFVDQYTELTAPAGFLWVAKDFWDKIEKQCRMLCMLQGLSGLCGPVTAPPMLVFREDTFRFSFGERVFSAADLLGFPRVDYFASNLAVFACCPIVGNHRIALFSADRTVLHRQQGKPSHSNGYHRRFLLFSRGTSFSAFVSPPSSSDLFG